MTDIVERLRACQGVLTHDPECNCAEAADEIERLRLRVKFLEDELKCPAALEPKPRGRDGQPSSTATRD